MQHTLNDLCTFKFWILSLSLSVFIFLFQFLPPSLSLSVSISLSPSLFLSLSLFIFFSVCLQFMTQIIKKPYFHLLGILLQCIWWKLNHETSSVVIPSIDETGHGVLWQSKEHDRCPYHQTVHRGRRGPGGEAFM